jgi:cob(I)alamin adenosyltransferase
MSSKIYTKQGDKGFTGLIGGNRVRKNNERLEAYGTIDELSSWIGMIRSYDLSETTKDMLVNIQRKLFDLGSFLAYDKENAKRKVDNLPMITTRDVSILEKEIDLFNKTLPSLVNFIMPGGDPQVSACHIARTVCRRAERRVVTMMQTDEVDAVILEYLNRLSDYLFVLARHIARHNCVDEILWEKGV